MKAPCIIQNMQVTWLYLDFSSNPDLESKLWDFKRENSIYPIQSIGGFSGLHKESHCYSLEDAEKIVKFISSGGGLS